MAADGGIISATKAAISRECLEIDGHAGGWGKSVSSLHLSPDRPPPESTHLPQTLLTSSLCILEIRKICPMIQII